MMAAARSAVLSGAGWAVWRSVATLGVDLPAGDGGVVGGAVEHGAAGERDAIADGPGGPVVAVRGGVAVAAPDTEAGRDRVGVVVGRADDEHAVWTGRGGRSTGPGRGGRRLSPGGQ